MGLLKELGLNIHKLVDIYSDSKATTQIAVNPVYHERTKHVEIDCHFIRENIMEGIVATKYVPTQEQPVDILTKGLTKVQHKYLSTE